MRISVEQIGGTESLLVEPGTTVGKVIELATGRDSSGYTAQVNDVAASTSQVLSNGDLVSIVPTKVKGGCA